MLIRNRMNTCIFCMDGSLKFMAVHRIAFYTGAGSAWLVTAHLLFRQKKVVIGPVAPSSEQAHDMHFSNPSTSLLGWKFPIMSIGHLSRPPSRDEHVDMLSTEAFQLDDALHRHRLWTYTPVILPWKPRIGTLRSDSMRREAFISSMGFLGAVLWTFPRNKTL